MSPAYRTAAIVAALGLLRTTAACAGAADGGVEDATSAKRDTELTHEPCDLGAEGARKVDVDNDGRPDIVQVFEGQRELCRAVDINRDSLIDAFVYFDEQGNERRREYGFDRDDRPDEIVVYEHGTLVRKLRETNNDRKIDTWDYFRDGRLVKEERDSSGDGYVDQWWSFPDPGNPKCAVVVSDVDGDGQPDEESRLDLCAETAAVAVPAPAPPSKEKKPGGEEKKPGGEARKPAPSPTSVPDQGQTDGGGAS